MALFYRVGLQFALKTPLSTDFEFTILRCESTGISTKTQAKFAGDGLGG